MSTLGKRYFHTDDPKTLRFLQNVIAQAIVNGQGVCLDVDGQRLQVKRGGSVWSSPLHGTPHMSRDEPNRD